MLLFLYCCIMVMHYDRKGQICVTKFDWFTFRGQWPIFAFLFSRATDDHYYGVRQVDRFENLVKQVGESNNVIDYIKLDVELSEIDFLQDMIFNSPHVLHRVKQIAMEVHDGKFSGTVLYPCDRFDFILVWFFLSLLLSSFQFSP